LEFDPLPVLDKTLEAVVAIARVAGDMVMDVYGRDFVVLNKADASPMTEADARAEAVIVPRLQALTPGVPVVAEEAASAGAAPHVESTFWLVDPLDGTKEFIGRNGEFTVNIALVHCGVPVLGVVLAPALGQLYAGARGVGAWVEEGGVRRPIACRQPPPEGLTVVSSRSHGDRAALAAFLAGRLVARQLAAGSSLKLCRVAEGCADLYPRLGRTMEWDIAAGHAVLAAAGGGVFTLDGRPLCYGKQTFENPHFVAVGEGTLLR
jgi:3'(2'), 5'-bisphosphate nucleotidase